MMARKFAIFVHADKGQLARIVHGFWYADQLKERDYPVEIIFDGAGTQGLASLLEPGHKYGELVSKALQSGVLKGACPYCARAFQVTEALSQAKIPLIDDRSGHPDLSRWVDEGYDIITL
ncbi:MAG: DsrE family protein [Armatimonadetes bacterium]|nr:DsrE family protein [Armatimonadota bacterium]